MYKMIVHHTESEGGENVHFRRRDNAWSRLRTQLRTRHAPDKVERALYSRHDQFADIGVLLSWYRRIARTQQSDLLRSSISLNTDDGSICQFRDDESVSQCFEKVLDVLDSASYSGLRICTLSAETLGTVKVYSFPYEVYLTLSGKVHNATRLFQLLTARLLMSYWASTEFEGRVIDALISEPSPEDPQWQPQLPSCNGLARTRPLTPLETAQRPLQLDPTMWTDSVYLEWQWLGNVPQYVNDVDIYIWEPFKQRPPRDFIRLILLERHELQERSLVMVASSSELLARLGPQQTRPDRKIVAMPSVDAQIFRLVVSVYRTIRMDVMRFLTQASARVERINMRSRSNPSSWKVQLLLHLQECYRQTAQQCDDAVRTSDMLVACVCLPSTAHGVTTYEHLAELRESKTDLEYLASQLRQKAEDIVAVKGLVQEQIELVQNYRNTVIAVLVALYVPISFVSSFLGMNITDHASDHYCAISPFDNFTATFVVTNNLGTKTWSLTSFWASAFPLAIGTIVIPIVAGPAFRWLAQFARRHAMWWRVIVMILTIGAVLAMNLVGISGFQILGSEAEHDYESGTESNGQVSKSEKLWIESDKFWTVQWAFSFTEFGILFILCSWHFHAGRKLRLRWPMPLFWTLLFLLNALNFVAIFGLLDWSAAGFWIREIVLPLLPWIMMFVA
ncbi:hypothetical protein LTR85_003808 [Meristemomyces frigidus]|nr:hypothetical protein LTR85_003808 [Meristemomyces frigidus]